MSQLLVGAGQAGISLLADWVRNQPPRGADSLPGAPGSLPNAPADDAGCAMCRAHADLAEAQALLAAMVVKADSGGAVPEHFQATILLAEQRLGTATEHLSRVAEERPELAEPALVLRSKISQAKGKLPARQGITRVTAQAAQVAVEDAWRDSVDLADAYFAAPADAEAGPQLRALVEALSPDERVLLARVLSQESEAIGP